MLDWSTHLHVLNQDPRGWTDQLAEWWTHGNNFVKDAVVLAGILVAYYVFRVVVLGAMARVARHTDNDLDDRLVHFTQKFSGAIFLFVAVVAALVSSTSGRVPASGSTLGRAAAVPRRSGRSGFSPTPSGALRL